MAEACFATFEPFPFPRDLGTATSKTSWFLGCWPLVARPDLRTSSRKLILACHLVKGLNGLEIDVESAKRHPLQHDSNCLPPIVKVKILSDLLCFKVECFMCFTQTRSKLSNRF